MAHRCCILPEDRLKRLMAEVLELSAPERARLAHSLIVSLDEDVEDPTAVERAWKDEIRRRVAEVDAGTAELVSAEEVIAELRRRRAGLEDDGDAGQPWRTVLDQIEARDW